MTERRISRNYAAAGAAIPEGGDARKRQARRLGVRIEVDQRAGYTRAFVEARARAIDYRRRRAARARLLWQWSALVSGAIVLAVLGLGLAFAGSPERLPAGTTVAGVPVGGIDAEQATRLLEQRYKRMRDVPVTFAFGERRWQLRPRQVVEDVNWGSAVQAARRHGEGFAPIRGLRRLGMRVFGADVTPPARVDGAALNFAVNRFARAIDVPRREPAVRLRGLRPEVVPGRRGRILDRPATTRMVVRALTALHRSPVSLPVAVDVPRLSERELEPALRRTVTALSAPVTLTDGPTRWRLPRWRTAALLDLPRNGRRGVTIGGPAATVFVTRLKRSVDRPPRDADFAVASGNRVTVIPARAGRKLDARAAAAAMERAVFSTTRRVAPLPVATSPPDRTTQEARAMGITGLVGTYTTVYGGEPNRIHNVQLVARLIDRTLIRPGAVFSFNGTTGERTAERGFKEAPVIINGELQTGLGGGVCQVSTTLFNAAYEAGLPIESRTNHALYIDHYPQGRDATVNYPDIDLRFTNDSGRWLLVRTLVGSSSLTVNLYGRPTGRRVESENAPLEETGPAPIERIGDPAMTVGSAVLEESGQPSRKTSVTRRVYSAGGELLSETTWQSWYRSEPRVIRVGTKPAPKPAPPEKPKPKEKKPDEEGSSGQPKVPPGAEDPVPPDIGPG